MIDVIVEHVKQNPPLCKNGGDLFFPHIASCDECHSRLAETMRYIYGQIPMLRIIISKDKFEELLKNAIQKVQNADKP